MTLVTIAEAAQLVKRHVSQIYRWIDAGKLEVIEGDDGVSRVDGAAVLRVEPTVKRGRPAGTARPATTRRRSLP